MAGGVPNKASSCTRKRPYLSPEEADAAILLAGDPTLHFYKCFYGEHFHIGHSMKSNSRKRRRERRLLERLEEESQSGN